MNIGFIGLGNMGGPMAANLAKAGHNVKGFDVAGVHIDGVSSVQSAAIAAQEVEIVFTMLPNGPILRQVADEILPHMKPSAVHADCSTVDVASCRAVAEMAAKNNVLAIDAPVSGGITGAAQGTLTFMAGGSLAGFERVAPLLDIMGSKSVHCGASGAGQAAKICNNMILGVSMIATCEAFVLADKLGLDRQKMYDVVSTSSGQSWSMTSYCPVPDVGPHSPADNGYVPGFASSLMLKDLNLSQQAAADVGATTPLGAHAAAAYQTFVDASDEDLDFSAILQALAAGHIT